MYYDYDDLDGHSLCGVDVDAEGKENEIFVIMRWLRRGFFCVSANLTLRCARVSQFFCFPPSTSGASVATGKKIGNGTQSYGRAPSLVLNKYDKKKPTNKTKRGFMYSRLPSEPCCRRRKLNYIWRSERLEERLSSATILVWYTFVR